MKTSIKIISITIVSFMMLFSFAVSCQKKNLPVRVLLVTGGHDFGESFETFMNSLNGIVVTHVKHPNALLMLRPENRASYDVVLLYDMPETIGEQEKKDFIDCLNEGKGLVVWHHAYASYRDWHEYKNIVGGRWYFHPWTDDKGVSQPASTAIHDVHFRVKVADKNHPVTKDIDDFDIIDETYGICYLHPKVHVLLTTDEPTSIPSVAWTHQYGKSKVATILLGHDQQAWNNPSFEKLLTQAIHWAK